MMNQGKSSSPDSEARHTDEARGSFVQPLAVALVSLLFGLLLFGMAMMDLRRLEDALLDVLKKRALYVVEGVERASQEGYRRLTRVGEDYRSLYPSLPGVDEAFSIQESLAKALIDIVRYIDVQQQVQLMPHDRLQKLAVSEHFHSIAILDENGQVAFQSGPVPPDVLAQAKGLAEGRQEVAIRLFDRPSGASEHETAGFVGIRKQEGKGAILLVLESKELQYWGLRISVQEAVEELQWGTGLVYVTVEDAAGNLLTQAGSAPVEKVEECLLLAASARDPNSPMSGCVKVGNIKLLEVFLSFKMDDQVIGKVRVGLETQQTDELLLGNRRHIFLWTGLMVAVGFFAMGLLYQTQNRHISRLQAVRERLYQAEKLSSLAKLGAKVAHEVRNPLNGISMAVQRLQREFAPAEYKQKKEEFERITHNVRDEIRRINTIIEDFLSLSRSDRLDLRQRSLVELLEKIVFLAQEEVQPRGIRIEKRWEKDSVSILMDANKMEQALLNIVRNAVESVSDHGSILISLEHQRKNLTSIKVRDTGAGIPAGEEQRIFDPYYTTKQKGTGLGLSIAHEIILAHGGEIRVESKQEQGTTFEILLPRLE
jgi:signal transduction histidine kinase